MQFTRSRLLGVKFLGVKFLGAKFLGATAPIRRTGCELLSDYSTIDLTRLNILCFV